MIETAHVRPRLYVVACFATKWSSIRTATGHAVLEFTFVRINVAGGTTLVLEMKGEHLIKGAAGAEFVALVAWHGHVRARKRECRLAMIGNRERRAVEVLNGVAAFAAVLIRRRGELPFVNIFVAIQTGREFHLINCVFTRGNVAFRTIYRCVLAQQGIFRSGMFFHAKE
jgi:hypothetical protein